ncbi:RNA polymerase sigma factor [Actinoalloteichus sp. GBA129-24]|uniref:RNA polymerase sigma factor n=1 Tax=Actinoalloteichus sp. GBA129-24 TaxID=1612551 RepID=UPI0018DD9C10|nr:sigma-70 family RNA polymerase sigma factor [Actinoalloteichus sp. GBA129-24]
MTPDEELVALALAGDSTSFGALFTRHRAGMTAVAIAVLGDPVEAEDAVQDAALTAMSRLADLRNPAALGPWLRTIVRNGCRMRLRSPSPVALDEPPSVSTDPHQALDRAAARDWVWHAIQRLSPPLQEVTFLRYFTAARSYQDVALACGVPMGTVRSRLNQARTVLLRELSATEHTFPDDASAFARARRHEAEYTIASGNAGEFASVLRDRWHPDATASWTDGRQVHGIRGVADVMAKSVDSGIRQRLVTAVAGRDVLVWQIDVLNPPGVAGCPARACWLLDLDRDRVRRLRLFHPASPGLS